MIGGPNLRRAAVVWFSIALLISPSVGGDHPSIDESPLPCQFIEELEFNQTRANASISWQLGFGPRIPGSNGSIHLRENMTALLNDSGWMVEYDMHDSETSDGLKAKLVNVFAYLPPLNETGVRKKSGESPQVILAAHYDSRDRSERDENESNRTLPLPGANDGASGVAVLLELARILPSHHLDVEVVLMFTDGEDWGAFPSFLGAKGWASNQTVNSTAGIRAFVLLDMIGDADLEVGFDGSGYSHTGLWNELQPSAAALGLHSSMPDCQGSEGSGVVRNEVLHNVWDDHIVMRDLKVPAVVVIDFCYGDDPCPPGSYWHTQQDTPDKVSAESLGALGRWMELSLLSGLGIEPVSGDERVIDTQEEETVPNTVESSNTLLTIGWGVAAIALLAIHLFGVRRSGEGKALKREPLSVRGDEDG